MKIKYVYNRKGQKYGCVVGSIEDDILRIGISRCNLKIDDFSKKKAVYLAFKRAYAWGKFVKEDWDKVILNHPGNKHVVSYLDKVVSHEDEDKFMSAIDFVLKGLILQQLKG